MSSDQPTTTGTFGKTPLLHVLMSLLERSSIGTLVIETVDSVRSALFINRGVPTKMRLGTPQARLGDILLEHGYLQRNVIASSYATALEKNQLHGRTLIEAGLVTDVTLEHALRSQLIQKLKIAAALPSDTVFGFYENVDYLSKWRSGATPVSPLVAAWALARSSANANAVATTIHHIEGYPLRLHAQAQIRGFGFERTELTLLDVLRARPQTIESLNRMGLISPHTLERLVYVLTLTRHFDFGRDLLPLGIGAVSERDTQLLERKASTEPSRPVTLGVNPSPNDFVTTRRSAVAPQPLAAATTPLSPVIEPTPQHPVPPQVSSQTVNVAPTPTAPRAPAKTDPTLGERRAQLEKRVQDLAKLNHFEVLGVPTDVSTNVVQETYLKLAKLFHPDRLPPDLADLKPAATKLFSRISEAHQVLTDPAKRQTYFDSLKRVGEDTEEEKVRRILRAANSFQKAEVLLKKRMIAAAELEANRAMEDDPDQPDYLALYAWIQSGKSDSEPRLPELLKMLNDALVRNPASEKNRYYRVQILKRLGRIDEAVADCRLIVEKNPHHVDALREIRLWDMRRSPHKSTPGTRPAVSLKTTGTSSHNKPPSNPPSPNKRTDSPPVGLFGRLFKR